MNGFQRISGARGVPPPPSDIQALQPDTVIEESKTPSNKQPLNTASEEITNLLHLVSEITTNLTNLSIASDDALRIKTATSALKLAALVRPPQDTIMSLFANMSTVSAIRLFTHWDGFNHIPSNPEGISCSSLAAKCNASESLLRRITTMLTSSRILHHVSPTHISHTRTSLLLRSSEPMAAMFSLLYTNIVEVGTILPEYLDTNGKKEPVGPENVPASFLAGQPDLGYFELLQKDEERMKGFMKAMSLTSHRRVPITGMYDMDLLFKKMLEAAEKEEEKEDRPRKERVVWVDVGGGEGHILNLFREEYPRLRRAKCAVMDLKPVIEEAKKKKKKKQKKLAAETSVELVEQYYQNVEFVAGDFMRDIPVKKAMVYYLRHVLRDYSDPVATVILKNIAEAMAEDSRVLISEQINNSNNPSSSPSPSSGVGGAALPLYAAFKDFSMLSIGGKERSLEDFERIAGDAGLRVEGLWRDKDKATPQGVLELVLRESGGGSDE
ncbi:S-adenosyl-L-methionine-dependent methyltransferase [Cladorrhinum sp. PSN332]|nr:S-adenosyl-L-methionine-dependent methyltransferase [Cladorrhinum sp. PSN332]